MSLPNVAQAAVDGNGHFTAPWRKWLEGLERQLSATGGTSSDVSAAIATIARALGSPDGSVEGIPPQQGNDLAIVSPDGSISVTGTVESGTVMLALQQLEDSGVGAALYKLTRDDWGRISGTQSATTSDLAEGSNLYYTDERAQDAVAALIAAGTHTGISFSYNDAGNSLSAAVSGGGGGSGAMSLIATSAVTVSAATNITFSGLNLSADGTYLLLISGLNAAASVLAVNLFYNSDTTATNYYRQLLVTDNTIISSARSNSAVVIDVQASAPYMASILIRADKSGNPRAISQINRDAAASIVLELCSHIRNNTANVTSLTLNTSVASAFAIGTTVSLYKITP